MQPITSQSPNQSFNQTVSPSVSQSVSPSISPSVPQRLAVAYTALDVQVGLQRGGVLHHEVRLDLAEQVQRGQAGHQPRTRALRLRHLRCTPESEETSQQ